MSRTCLPCFTFASAVLLKAFIISTGQLQLPPQRSPVHPSLCCNGIFLNHKSDHNTSLPKNLEGAFCYLQCNAHAIKCHPKPLFRIWLRATSPACPRPSHVFLGHSLRICSSPRHSFCCLLMGNVPITMANLMHLARLHIVAVGSQTSGELCRYDLKAAPVLRGQEE